MDFHSLSRRELQALCKKNKIPANLTNVAMADALHSLDFVDGIEELLKPCESETTNSSMESPAKSETVASVPRTGRRTTQQKTFKHDSEALQTSTRSRCRTRGTVVRGVGETKNDMLETPALPTTRRRAAAASVQAKLESMMKECEPKEKIEDQIEGEKKEVPKTPAAVLTSQRKQVKAKSSVRQVYSTRRSTRLAGNQEASTQDNEMSGSITFDEFSEETDENLEVDSEQCSIHKNEELAKNGTDMKTSGSLEKNKLAMEDGVQQESDSNLVVVALDTKAEEGSEEVAHDIGSEDVHISEKKVVENGKEMASGGMQALEDVSGAKIEVAGEELMEEPEVDHPEVNFDSAADALEVARVEEPIDEYHVETYVDSVAPGLEVAGEEEPMEESEVDHAEANVDGAAHGQEFAIEEEPKEEYDVEVASEEEPMEESDHAESDVDCAAHGEEVTGEEEPMEEYDVDHAEANVDSAIDAPEVAGVEEPMEESEVDHAEANVESAVHALPPLASVIPSALASTIEKSSATINIGQVQVSDDKENINNFGKNLVLTEEQLKKNQGIAGNNIKQSLHDLSLRKLTKMLKELQITKDPSGKEIAKIKAPSSRSALQALPENRLNGETEN